MKFSHDLRLIFTVATFSLFISPAFADELPDFSGIWVADQWATEPWPVKPPFTEKGQAEQDVWATDPLNDPTHLCVFHLVRIASAPFPHEIIQQDDRITMLYEYQHQVRRVFLDGRDHPDDPLLSLMGHSTGKIEGNTLTIDTIGVEAGYLRPQAFPHSENIHVIEKHTLLEPGKKRIEMTIDDPEYYRKPITVAMDWSKTDDGEVVLWESETYPRNILHRRGWKQRGLSVGDIVEVEGRRARDGSPRLQILTIIRPSDGWEGVGYEPESID